ncbi:MAG: hypothetical protein RIC14_05495 [Filomicrobium sp.]
MKLTDLEKINRLVDERLEVIQLGLSLGRLGPAEATRLGGLLTKDKNLSVVNLGSVIIAHEDAACRALIVHCVKAIEAIEGELRQLGVEIDDDQTWDLKDAA